MNKERQVEKAINDLKTKQKKEQDMNNRTVFDKLNGSTPLVGEPESTTPQPKEETSLNKKTSLKKKTMADYVTRQATEVEILAKDVRAEFDESVIEYLKLKREVTSLTKAKNELEKKLDAMFIEGGEKKLFGNKYSYAFKVSEFDKVVSKAEILEAGLLDEFKSRGFIKIGLRKARVIDVL